MPGLEEARSKGASAVGAVRKGLAERAADLLRRDPELRDTAVAVRTVAAVDVVQRFLERSVERRPSAMATIGLNALQLLAFDQKTSAGDPAPSPVTIVFTDLEGFTSYTSRHGDEAALALLAEHHRVIGPIVRSRGGKVVKRIGDGLMLSFPSAEAGLLAALELVDSPPGALRLRAGVHTGEAVVTSDDLIGHDVNVTARVAAAAKGGQVLASVAARDAVGDLRGVGFGRARRRAFKGVDGPVSVCPVQRGA